MGLQRRIKRATGTLMASALGASLLLGAVSGARADKPLRQGQDGQESTPSLNRPLDVELSNAPLQTAIKMIEQKTGLSIVFLPSAQPYTAVTVSLKGKRAEDALRLIAQSAGADIWYQDGAWFIGPRGSAPKPAPQPAPQTEPTDVPTAEPQHWEKIFLTQAEPQELLHRLFGLNSGPLQDVSAQLTVNMLRSLVNPNRTGYFDLNTSNLNPNSDTVKNAQTGQVIRPTVAPFVPLGGSANSAQTGANNAAGAQTGANSAAVTPPDTSAVPTAPQSDQGAQRDNDSARDEFGRGGFQRPGGFPGGGGGQQGPGGANGQQQGGFASALLPDGITVGPFAYEVDNSILVKGTPEAIRELREIIRFFDVAPKQVSIKAEFITVSQNDQNQFGITWSFARGNLQAGANTGYSSSNTAYITYAIGNLQTQLSFILTTNRGKLVAAPTATTFNNLPVTFSVGQQIPVFVSQPVVSQNGTVVLATSIIVVPVQTFLQILPRINADNTITMLGQVGVEAQSGTVTGPDGETAPIISTQQVSVQRRIHNGETLVIGGLVQKNDQLAENRVPLLGDLPIIGNLFRSRNVTISDSELLAFITPTIILDHEDNSQRNNAGGNLLAPGGGAPVGGPSTGSGVNP